MSKFFYYNINPDGKRENDCVTRAIALASGLSYQEVREKLHYTAKLLNCEKLCVCCYRHLLDDVLKYKRVNCDGYSLGEFADKNPFGVYLVRMDGHISCLIDGTVYDIWDCRREWLTDVWKVE